MGCSSSAESIEPRERRCSERCEYTIEEPRREEHENRPRRDTAATASAYSQSRTVDGDELFPLHSMGDSESLESLQCTSRLGLLQCTTALESLQCTSRLGLLTGSCYAILGPNAAIAVKNYHGGFYHPDFPHVYMPTAKEWRKTRQEFLTNPPPGKLAFPNLSSGALLLHPERENEPMPIAAFKTAAIGARDATELDLYLRSVGEAVKHKRYASASDEAARLLSLTYVKLNQLLSVLLRHVSIRCRDLAVFTLQPMLILDALDHFDADRVHSAFRREQVHAKVSLNPPECNVQKSELTQLVSPRSCTVAVTQTSVNSSFDSEDGGVSTDGDAQRHPPAHHQPTDPRRIRSQLLDDEESMSKFLGFLHDDMLVEVNYTVGIVKRLVETNSAGQS